MRQTRNLFKGNLTGVRIPPSPFSQIAYRIPLYSKGVPGERLSSRLRFAQNVPTTLSLDALTVGCALVFTVVGDYTVVWVEADRKFAGITAAGFFDTLDAAIVGWAVESSACLVSRLSSKR
jgi:hypothetical protein